MNLKDQYHAHLVRYVKYHRANLKTIANGYSHAQNLAKLALEWEIHSPRCATLTGEKYMHEPLEDCDCDVEAFLSSLDKDDAS